MSILAFFGALGDELTYRVCLLIARYRLGVGEIAAALELAQPRVSHKLAKLRRHGLVAHSRQGRRVTYRLSEPWRALLLAADSAWREQSPEMALRWKADETRLRRLLGAELKKRTDA